jgi:hypothetical protein
MERRPARPLSRPGCIIDPIGILFRVHPFPVTCETCRARLKIRAASVIGEIHACPRCGGMVHIIPPADWAEDATAKSAAMIGVAAAAIPTPDNASVVESVTPPSQFTNFDVDESLIAPALTPVAPPVINTAILEPTADVASLPADTATITFTSRLLSPPIILWGGFGAAALFVSGFLAAMWFIDPTPAEVALGGGNTLPALAATSTIAPTVENAVTQSNLSDPNPYRVAIDAQRDSEETEEEQVANAATESVGEHEAASPVIESPMPSDEAEPLANLPTLPELPPQPPPTSEAGAATETDAPPTAEDRKPPQPVLKFDPLNFDPLALGFTSRESPEGDVAPSSIADDTAQAENLPPPADDRDANSVDDALRGPAPLDETITVQRGPASEGALQSDVEQQLALPLESIDLRDVPLSRFLESLAEVAGVPITLDPAALAMAGTSPRSETTVRARNTTLKKLLRDTLENHRLDFVELDGQIVIVRPSIDQRRSVNYELKDLVGEVAAAGANAPHFVRLLERFVAPKTWQAAGGEGTIEIDGTKLRIEQSHGVHYQVLIFCERLRLSRGLAPRSNYPAKLLSVESPYAELAAPLGESTTFTFLPWTPFTEIVRHWEDATGLAILIDWRYLAETDLAPTSPLSCSAIDHTWDEAITAILEPLGLAWRAVDGGTIQITSQAAADQTRTIEFYSVPQSLLDQFASSGALTESLIAELENDSTGGGNPSPPQVELEFDPPSGRLIALGNAAVHRYFTKRLRDSLGAVEVLAAPIE